MLIRRIALAVAMALPLALVAVPARAANTTVTENYAGTSSAEQTADITYDPTKTGRPAVILFHGGSWSGVGGKADVAAYASKFVAKGYVTVNVEYRGTSDFSWKKGLTWTDGQAKDVLEAVDWFHANADDYGVDSDRIATYGFSAGGHLAAYAGYKRPTKVKAILSASGALQPHRFLDVAFSDPDVGHGGSFPNQAVRDAAGWAMVAMRCPKNTWTDCGARWNEFMVEKHITEDSPPIYMTQGTGDTGVSPATVDSMKYWSWSVHGVEAVVVKCINWGHTPSCMFDSGTREADMFDWLAVKVA